MSHFLELPLSSLILVVVCYASGYKINEDDYTNEDYYYETELGNGASDSSYNQGFVTTYSIPCYSCHFIFQHDHEQGPLNCKDPFSTFDIPKVDCRGACAKIYRKLEGKSDFELSRNCMPNCKEFRSDKGSIECCTTGLCNGSIAAATFNGCRTLAIVLLAILVVVISLHR